MKSNNDLKQISYMVLIFTHKNSACWFVAIHSDVTSMLVRKSLKKLMGVFKDFSVCLKNKNININKTDCHDRTELLSKVALNTIKQTLVLLIITN
jgi:hypothetical protein